jgi:hypothetical protein
VQKVNAAIYDPSTASLGWGIAQWFTQCSLGAVSTDKKDWGYMEVSHCYDTSGCDLKSGAQFLSDATTAVLNKMHSDPKIAPEMDKYNFW